MTNSEWWMFLWDIWGPILEAVLNIDAWIGRKQREAWNKENPNDRT